MNVRVGTQGWSYAPWVGSFYPPKARSGDWLQLYARAFDTVEVDSTFYALPPPERFESWAERTPENFLFTLKMPGEVTHELRLEDPRLALRFCDDARLLGPRLGPILIQLPPGFGPGAFPTVAAFLQVLPVDLPFAIEFREREWLVPQTMALLEDTNTALAVSTGPWLSEPEAREAATMAPGPLVYLRWMGTPRRQPDLGAMAADRDEELERWAATIRALDADQVVAYFNNDYQGHSPASARKLQRALGQEPIAPEELTPQRELFG